MTVHSEAFGDHEVRTCESPTSPPAPPACFAAVACTTTPSWPRWPPGHDALLVPTYTPIRTDEDDVSQPRIFFGGINVYLQQNSSLFRHTPWFFDRLLDGRRCCAGCRASPSRRRPRSWAT